MKYNVSISLLLLFSLATIVNGQSAITNTNGLEDYWNPNQEELFRIFKKKYWTAQQVRHLKEVTDHVLLVRLEGNTRRMEALKKAGKKKALSKLMKQNDKINSAIVSSMEDNYDKGTYYFYYPEDAEAIFEQEDYSKLYTSLTEKASGVVIENAAYVLMYRTPPGQHIRSYCLHLWDMDKISIIRKHTYLNYKSVFSTKVNYYKTLEIFCQDIDEALAPKDR